LAELLFDQQHTRRKITAVLVLWLLLLLIRVATCRLVLGRVKTSLRDARLVRQLLVSVAKLSLLLLLLLLLRATRTARGMRIIF
jgi:hypothetical protein